MGNPPYAFNFGVSLVTKIEVKADRKDHKVSVSGSGQEEAEVYVDASHAAPEGFLPRGWNLLNSGYVGICTRQHPGLTHRLRLLYGSIVFAGDWWLAGKRRRWLRPRRRLRHWRGLAG